MRQAASRPAAMAPRPRLKGAPSGASDSTQRIVDAVTTAITERRLAPGTKLAEQKLANSFQVSRTIVRQALNRLSTDKLITLEPARGAHVAQPSTDEARQVFEVRRILEAAAVKRLAESITPRQVRQLRAHVRDEAAGFHVLMAGMLRNDTFAELLGELLSRCSLIGLMSMSARPVQHPVDEHLAIVDALERHDSRAAVRLLEAHLHKVEMSLQLGSHMTPLGAAFSIESLP